MWHMEHWTAVLTLLGLIRSAYRDLYPWILNQQPQYAEAKTLPLGHRLMPHISEARLTGHGIYIYISSSSHSASTDFSEFFSPSLPIIHHSWQIFQITPCVHIELLLVSSCWLANTDTSIWRGPLENVTYEFVLASLVVSCISCLSYSDGFRDGR